MSNYRFSRAWAVVWWPEPSLACLVAPTSSPQPPWGGGCGGASVAPPRATAPSPTTSKHTRKRGL